MRINTMRWGAALLAASALTFGGTAAMAAAPAAAPAGFVQADPNPALVNGSASTTLTIHKYLGAAGTAGNGTQMTTPPALPTLGNVNFDVYQVFTDSALTQKVDLTTNTGWDAAASVTGYTLSAADVAAGSFTVGGTTYYLKKDGTATTGTDGSIAYTTVGGVGLYLVSENLGSSTGTTQTSGTTTTAIDKGTITPAAPFFVTLPMTDPVNLNSWMYNVHVYPKNQSDTITKAVSDATTYTTGSPITYSVTTTIPTTTPLGYYYVQDFNEYVTASGVTVKVGTTTLTGCDGATGTGTGPCDYYYWLDSDSATVGSQLKVAFTPAGLTALEAAKAADPTATVVTTISGTVLSVPATGVVPNQASFIPSSSWYANHGGTTPLTPPTDTPPGTPVTPPTPETPGIPSNEVKSYFGNITVNKTLVGTFDGATAAGAEFAVFVDPTPTTACTADDVTGTALSTATIAAGATSVTFEPLRASNWANNAALAAASTTNGWIQYCVVETKAPAGYNLNAEPFTATIDWATGTSTLTRTAVVAISDELSNLGNNLPLTGGAGVAAVSLLALLLVGGGVAYYVVVRRREEQEV